MGEGNHNLDYDFPPPLKCGRKIMKSVLRFFQIFTLLLHLVNTNLYILVAMAQLDVCLPGTRGRGFEPVLMRCIFGGKYPSA